MYSQGKKPGRDMWRRIMKYVVRGVFLGVALALFGILVKCKAFIKNGVFVEYKHLRLDPYVLYYIKQLRPYYQTSKVTVSTGFRKFVGVVDDALGNSRLFLAQHFVIDSMSLLSDDRCTPEQDVATLDILKHSMETLLTDLVLSTTSSV